MTVSAIVLAAGEGTRMRSTRPKPLHMMCGRPMVMHVIAALERLQPTHTALVVGHGAEQVTKKVQDLAPSWANVVFVEQARQRGTGDAAAIGMTAFPGDDLDDDSTVVVVPGDTPLLLPHTLDELVATHVANGSAATLLTSVVEDPTGYGRVITGKDGRVVRIVEQRDASPDERAINEVATSIYAFRRDLLGPALRSITPDNAQGELYLTDVVGLHRAAGLPVHAHVVPDAVETMGINDRVQLGQARALLRDRIVEQHQRAGVTVVDPLTTWIDVGVRLEQDVVVHPGTQLHGRTTIRAGAVVGPDTTLTDTEVGEGAHVVKSHCTGAVIDATAEVGPYTYLRPGTRLGVKSKAGAFVEIKASAVGDGSKVPHLSYVGDATIGEGSNIGAATVFVNYDGRDKHQTVVGSDVRIGSDTMLVAPVEIGDGAYTAAGSVITDDVPAGALGVGRARQRNIEGWVERKRGRTDHQGKQQQS